MSAAPPWHALGACLSDARHRAALTQHEIARQIGISQAAYSQFERGLVRPRPALLLPLALRLGADLAEVAALSGYPLEQLMRAGPPDRKERTPTRV